MKRLLVFDSHPVQYRVPIWISLAKVLGNDFEVVYATDCTLKGHSDVGFGKKIAWDEPMLSDYKNTILNCENGTPLSGWNSLSGKGIRKIFKELDPKVVLLTGLNYRYDFIALSLAIFKGIPVWLRCETQDEAGERSRYKSFFRSLIYKFIYKGVDKIFYIGELNKKHYIKHGVHPKKLVFAPYFTVDRFQNLSLTDKDRMRDNLRENLKINKTDLVIGFSGKLINKKNPDILFNVVHILPPEIRKKVHLYFLGSGELEADLRNKGEEITEQFGVKSHFAGFVNQTQLPSHYLAMDIMVLPSRRMGETWGLVVNEAMQAGCSIITSDAVGSQEDFKQWERFKVFKEGNVAELSEQIIYLSKFNRDFEWASKGMEIYSCETVVNAFLQSLK